jgi:hypothetical protein
MGAGGRIVADYLYWGGCGIAAAHHLASLGTRSASSSEPFLDTSGASLPSSICAAKSSRGTGWKRRVSQPRQIIVGWSEATPTIRTCRDPGFHVDRGRFDRCCCRDTEAGG